MAVGSPVFRVCTVVCLRVIAVSESQTTICLEIGYLCNRLAAIRDCLEVEVQSLGDQLVAAATCSPTAKRFFSLQSPDNQGLNVRLKKPTFT